jgi:hypothetical protein
LPLWVIDCLSYESNKISTKKAGENWSKKEVKEIILQEECKWLWRENRKAEIGEEVVSKR